MPQPEIDAPSARVTMFCSTGENIGQTTTLINTALLLTEAGRRVLVVDARPADVRVFRYLSTLPGAASNRRPRSPRTGRTDRWRIDGHTGVLTLDLLTLDGFQDLDQLPDRGAARVGAAVLAGYDEVLVDAPLAHTDRQFEALARVPDALAVCFALNSWSIGNAAALARQLRDRTGTPVSVLAVGLRADAHMHDQLRIARARVRAEFADLDDPDEFSRYVEVPYAPQYMHSDRLAVADEPPGADDGLRPSLTQLAEEITRARPTGVHRAVVVHTPRGVAWAEWLAERLEFSGVPTTLTPFAQFTGERPGPGAALLIVSPTGLDEEKTQMLAALSHPSVRLVLVDEAQPPVLLTHHEQIDLRRLSEPQALARLRRSLHLAAPVQGHGLQRRLPRLPERASLPARASEFVGRDATLDRLREIAAEPERCLLTGDPGIGKSELAMEFCHRFAGDYDLVWWRSPGAPGPLHQGLAELAGRHGDDGRWPEPAPGERWLLVFDDLRDTSVLQELPRASAGVDVLVTTRLPGERVSARHTLTVEPFTPEESRELLTTEVPGLLPEQAERVGQTVGNVPLTLRMAAAWLGIAMDRSKDDNQSPAQALRQAVVRFGEDFRLAQARLQAAPDGDTLRLQAKPGRAPLPLVMLEVSLASLMQLPGAEAWSRERAGSAALVWLLEACALLAEADADVATLTSPQMQAALARQPAGPSAAGGPQHTLSDPLMVDVGLWSLARHRLIEVDFERPDRPVRQHRTLGELIRSRLGEHLGEREAELREVVIGHSPPPGGQEPAEERRARYQRQARYLTRLRAWEDTRPTVRQGVLDHLSGLLATKTERAQLQVVEIGSLAEQAWESDPPSPQYLRLLNHIASAHRDLGDYAQATRYARRALRGHRHAFGANHPRTLLSGDSYCAALRATGHFDEAVVEGRHVVRGLTELLGSGHQATFQAESNLTLAEALVGNPRRALGVLRYRFDRRRAVGGEDDKKGWGLALTLASTHRALGEYRESFTLLKEYLARRTLLKTGDVQVLNAEVALAITERRLGRPQAALDRDTRALEKLVRLTGERSVPTLRCRMSRSIDLYQVGKYDDAVVEARRCLKALQDTFGPAHPYTQLCRVRLGVHTRAAGQLAEALQLGELAHQQLLDRLGDAHPWVLVAAASLAGTLVAHGRLDEAARLEEDVLDGFDAVGMTQHPSRELVAGNLADTRARAAGRALPPEAAPRPDIDLELPGV
jgi:tetratricopeptide (TPR) repeat protein